MIYRSSVMSTKCRVCRRTEEMITFREAVDQFIFYQRAKGVTKESIQTFNWIIPVFMKDMDIEDDSPVTILTEETFDVWKDILINDRELSSETINCYVARMRTFCYYTMHNGYLPEFKISLVKMQEKPPKVYSETDLKTLLKAPDKNNFCEYRTWLIISFILGTGARAGTIRFIKWEDVNFEDRTVCYRHLKNKQFVIIPIPDSLCKMLLEYRAAWDTGSEWLFCDIGAGQLTTSAIRQAFNKYCKKRGVQSLGVHALRSSFAKTWVKNKGGVFELQTMLCHSTLTMTRRYVKLFSEDLANDVRAYNPLDSLRRGTSRAKTVSLK